MADKTFTIKQWPGKKFRINEAASYIDNNGPKQCVVDVLSSDEWVYFARETEWTLNELRGIPNECSWCFEPAASAGPLDEDDVCELCQ